SGNAARVGWVVGLVVRRERVTLTGHRFAIEENIRTGSYHRGRWKAIVVGADVTEQCNGGTHNSNLLCALPSLRSQRQNRGMAKHKRLRQPKTDRRNTG